jgi:hypothetical protein
VTSLRIVAFGAFGILGAVLIAACDPPTDLGNPCVLPNPDGGPGNWTATSSTNDYYNDATAECQNLVCLRPAGSPLDAGLGFCSSPCTPANSSPNSPSDDCSGASIPLVCRSADLDPSFIAEVLDAGGSALLDKYLGSTGAPIFCTTPVDAGS